MDNTLYSIIYHDGKFFIYRDFECLYSIDLYFKENSSIDNCLDYCCERLKLILRKDIIK